MRVGAASVVSIALVGAAQLQIEGGAASILLGDTAITSTCLSQSTARVAYLTPTALTTQDVGGNVNAGWYIVSAGKFGLSVLRYWLELFEIYGPTGVWGQVNPHRILQLKYILI